MRTRAGLSGSALKWIAIVSMALDHVGACILEVYLMNTQGVAPLAEYFTGQWNTLRSIDRVLRYIGRPAFPIFCFLLVEGYVHTRDVKKYALRLGVFALISDIPFDLALRGTPLYPGYQNVFFTLFIGLLVIWCLDAHQEKPWIGAVAMAVGALLAEYVLNTDYGAFGVLLIAVLYLTRERRALQCVVGAILSAWETTAPLAFVLIWFYNGERGRQPKWFFYWFYPVHLLLYYLIGAWALPALLL